MRSLRHQYVDRASGQVKTERLFGDKMINLIYSRTRERMPWLFRALTSGRASSALGQLNYDLPLGSRLLGGGNFVKEAGLDLSECIEPPESLDTPRKIFERQIRYWEARPMPENGRAIVSPADSRVLMGSLSEVARVSIKEKFFGFDELLGGKEPWVETFKNGDFAIFRLTPEHYHYNHAPVSGRVIDYYEIDGTYHSCNPAAVVAVVTPYSKNKRVVTVIDTGCHGRHGRRPGGDGRDRGVDDRGDPAGLQRVALRYATTDRAGHVLEKRAAQKSFPPGQQHRCPGF